MPKLISSRQIDSTKNKLAQVNIQQFAQNIATPSTPSNLLPKLNQPENFTGSVKESVLSWTTHMTNYLCHIEEPQAMSIDVSYLQGTAHEWWIK